MFDTSYNYNKVNKIKSNDGVLLETLIYRFKSKNNLTYLVNIEKYKYDVYILKFHLKNHTDSNNKYSLIVHHAKDSYDFDVSVILNTCVEILLEIKNENENASFGFKGSPDFDGVINNTRRYRVYKLLTENKFSTRYFEHRVSSKDSTYFLLNKNKDVEKLFLDINKMFIEYYN